MFTDHGLTGPDTLEMTDADLQDFVRDHARSCMCAWCCDVSAREQDAKRYS